MNARFVAVFLAFCCFATTAAAAKTRTSADSVTEVKGDAFMLKEHGPAVLSGIWLPKGTEPGLKVGDTVEVKPLERDRMGRTPVLLYKKGATAALQEQLIGEGKAMVHDRAATPPAWRAAENAARKAKRGLWAESAQRTDTMEKHYGQMVRARGKVARTYKSRTMHYINFKEDWRTDFSVRIPRKFWRAFGKDFEIADGTCVEVRGYVFMDNGPMMEIARPEQLEILDANACAR